MLVENVVEMKFINKAIRYKACFKTGRVPKMI